MSFKFRVGIVQSKSDFGSLAENTEKGIQYIQRAKSLEADIVLFPECWITGYSFPCFSEIKPLEDAIKSNEFASWSALSLNEESVFLKKFCETAKESSVGIVITGFAHGIKRPRNSAFVIDRSGNILMRYDKVHTCDFDDERLLESGEEFNVCEFDGVKIGVMICYDREYPESARCLMLKGAEIILVPNDCKSMAPRLKALSTRAYENMTGMVMANAPGVNAGCSCAYSPIVWDENEIPVDNTIVECDATTEGVFIAEFDIDELRNYRRNEMMGNTYRKVSAYKGLLDKRIDEPFLR